MDDSPNCGNEAAFSNFSGVVSTLPKRCHKVLPKSLCSTFHYKSYSKARKQSYFVFNRSRAVMHVVTIGQDIQNFSVPGHVDIMST